jgi:oligogalacturonide transport system permease protein
VNSRPVARGREMDPRTREAVYGYGFVMLWIIGFGLFTFIPLVQTFLYSRNQVTVQATGIQLVSVGWANYSRALFTDPNFVQLLIEYAVETLVSVPIILIFSMIIAMLLNGKFRARCYLGTRDCQFGGSVRLFGGVAEFLTKPD